MSESKVTYHRIYAVVRQIPAGRVATYGDVAESAGLSGQARLVGYALHALPPHSTVPWHRVINAKGGISAGHHRQGADVEQRIRLEAEGIVFQANGRTSLERFRWRPENALRSDRGAYPSLPCEGDAARDVKFMSLAVRMKLDLAGCKVSLRDWQAIPVDTRWELHEMEAESDAAIERFRRLLEHALEQADRPPPHRLPVSETAKVKEWTDAAAPPQRIADLDDSQQLEHDWPRLGRYGRYVLWYLATKGDIPRFKSAVRELQALLIR